MQLLKDTQKTCAIFHNRCKIYSSLLDAYRFLPHLDTQWLCNN